MSTRAPLQLRVFEMEIPAKAFTSAELADLLAEKLSDFFESTAGNRSLQMGIGLQRLLNGSPASLEVSLVWSLHAASDETNMDGC